MDAGSAAVKIVVMDENTAVLETFYGYHRGDIPGCIRDLLASSEFKEFDMAALTAGTPAGIHGDGRFENTVSFIEGIKHFYPGVRNILLAGAEKFGRIIFNAQGTYRRMKANSTCAAGTGSFLDQQALRLGIDGAAGLADLAGKSSGEVPRIASRCSVFAKTDLIHAQQEGWGLPEISEGLCRGLARNIGDTLFPGEQLEAPVFMAGGVALNKRVVTYLADLAGTEIQTAPMAPFYGAIGAVLRARAKGTSERTSPWKLDDILVSVKEKRKYVHKALESPARTEQESGIFKSWNYSSSVLGEHNPVEIDIYAEIPRGQPLRVHLGIDIGSTSTKASLTDENRQVRLALYTRTAGDPIRAAQGLLDAMDHIQTREGVTFEILSSAVTGSGRRLIGAIVGADSIIDEITAHARAAIELEPQVDTIIEIGGQDSKFTVLVDQAVVFSNMNTVCAAGTGSFIEEQAFKLGVPIRDYEKRALGKPSPATSDRCTVFMERDLNNYQNKGYQVDELLAATLFSVADNYLSRVAMEGSIGNHIVFQGATAKNRALVSAFEQRLGKPIRVSPFCHITGAMGASFQLLDDTETAPGSTKFKGLGLAKEKIDQRFSVCEGCTNHCKLHIITVKGEEIVYGYLCGRGQGDKTFISKNSSGFDLLRERRVLMAQSIEQCRQKAPGGKKAIHELLGQAMLSLSSSAIHVLNDAVHQAADSALKIGKSETGSIDYSRIKIGIPRALYLQEDAYLWKFFFEELGFSAVLGRDSPDQLIPGKRIAGADFCAPISMIHGQAMELLEKADYVFLPVYLEDQPKNNTRNADRDRRMFCNYSQYTPTLVGTATGRAGHILTPLIYSTYGSDAQAVTELREMIRGIADQYGLALPAPSAIEKPYRAMKQIKTQYGQNLLNLCRRVQPEPGEFGIMLTGRPYTVLSKGMNKGIPDMFAQQGFKIFFHDMIQTGDRYSHDRELQAYHWFYASKVIEAACHCRDTLNLYPVLVTSFKCGPDSFAMESFKKILDAAKKPYLILQIDEHDSSVGYETRVEAAIRAFRNHFYTRGKAPAGGTSLPRNANRIPEKKGFPRSKTVLIPNWDPLVSSLLAAALRGHGIDALPLEETPDLIREAMSLNTGQCIPVNVIARETIHYIQTHHLNPGESALWTMKALWPCNIPLYPLQLESIFARTGGGLEAVEVYPGDMIFMDVSPRMTLDAYYAFGLGGLIRKITCRIRPYEVHPGSTDTFAAECLENCIHALETGKPMVPVIKEIARGIEKIRVNRGNRPKVAIFGDFYVRDNDIFNQDLIRSIEKAGGEVVITSYVEYLKATVDSIFERLIIQGKITVWAGYKAVILAIASIEKSLERKTGLALSDGSWSNRNRQIAYRHFGIRPEMAGENFDNSLKILKILEEYPDLTLFLQASPAFCCPALVTEAMGRVIESVTGVPVLSITYDGTGAYKNDVVEPYLAEYGKQVR